MNAKKLNTVDYDEDKKGFYNVGFLSSYDAFAAKAYELFSKGKTENYAFSPLSAYFALVTLYECAEDIVKRELEEFFDLSPEDISKSGAFMKDLIRVPIGGDEFDVSRLDIVNSIWFNEGEEVEPEGLRLLAEKLYCQAFETPFKKENKQANEAIKAFVKEKTHGLINKDFGLDESTIVAILNALYLKDLWRHSPLYVEEGKFFASGKELIKEFAYCKYEHGVMQSTEVSDYFWAKTQKNYAVIFILPKKGKTLREAMGRENLYNVMKGEIAPADFLDESSGREVLNYTRCIFPKFEISSSTDLKEKLVANGYLATTFEGFSSSVIKKPLKVDAIKQDVVLKVDDKGVEGAAVTVIKMVDSGCMPIMKRYHDFLVDRDFGFIITDYKDTALFIGQYTE